MKRLWIAMAMIFIVVANVEAQSQQEGGPTTGPTTRASRPTTRPKFSSLSDILATLPSQVIPAAPDGWNAVRIDEANKALQENVNGQSAQISMRVGQVDRTPEGGRYKGLLRIGAPPARIRSFTSHMWSYFSDEQQSQVATIRVGTNVRIFGTINEAYFSRQPQGVVLVIDLFDSQLVK